MHVLYSLVYLHQTMSVKNNLYQLLQKCSSFIGMLGCLLASAQSINMKGISKVNKALRTDLPQCIFVCNYRFIGDLLLVLAWLYFKIKATSELL